MWLWMLLVSAAEAQTPAARVMVAEVQQRVLAAGQTFVGTVIPLRSSTVGSSVEGLVTELVVEEGDAVERGDTLAQLRTEQLRLQLAVANAELDVLTNALAELNTSLPDEITQAEARMLAAKALMQFTARRLKRTQALLARKTISEDELQEIESAALAADEKYRENQTAFEQAKAVLPAKLEQAKARLNAQRNEIARLQDDIDQHKIVAPFTGFVTQEHTEIGQWIAKGASVVDVVELASVEIEVPVPESSVSSLRVGTTARVTVAALPTESWEAPVAAIVPQADVRSRSFPVKVRLQNPSGPGGVLLKPGMFARVTLPVGDPQSVLLVPKDAVVLGGDVPVVYVADPLPTGLAAAGGPPQPPAAPGGPPTGPASDSMARRVPVELGAGVDGLIEVRGPLKAGDRVVVEGNERLFPGSPLIIIHRRGAPAESKRSTASPSP
ncbi:MAG: efflux RND transporter periplasmic adaptor subunit [Pirellulales bacterium]|nr:efflux RND transporter periplasmic adaptor subunit [Pirellulales bacterium]